MIKEIEALEDIIAGEDSVSGADECYAFIKAYYRARENGWDELYTKCVESADWFCEDCRVHKFQFVRITNDDEQIAAFEEAGCTYVESDGETVIMKVY